MPKMFLVVNGQTIFFDVSPETHEKLVKASIANYGTYSPIHLIKNALKLYGEVSEDLLIKYLKE